MEDKLLAAAQAGDEDAFRRLVEPHRAELHVHCYRMLGSLHDAEDALQETLLRAWRALPRFGGPRRLRPWLYAIATNACRDQLARRARRALPAERGAPAAPDDDAGAPLADAEWLEPYPDQQVSDGYAAPHARYEQREAVELAFVAALQHLPGTQRAALILRDVLGFSAREAADALDTSVPAVNSALQRARGAIDRRLPDRSQQATLRALGDARVRELVARYIDAWERGDVEALVAILAADATFSMPPYAVWWRGAEVIAGFAREPVHRYLATTANGQPAMGCYRRAAEGDRYVAEALALLTLESDRVKAITAYMRPDLFTRFGLPDALTGLTSGT